MQDHVDHGLDPIERAKAAEVAALKEEKKPVYRPDEGDQVQQPAMNPFARLMMQLGAAIGRDVGMLAVQAIEEMRGGVGACLYFSGETVPEVFKREMPDDMRARLVGLAIVPQGQKAIPILHDGPTASKTNADGSTTWIFMSKDDVDPGEVTPV